MNNYELSMAGRNERAIAIYALVILIIIITEICVVNIMYRKNLERRLSKSKNELEKNIKFLKTLLNAIPTPVFYKDAQGRYKECNVNYEMFVGKSKGDILNKTIFEIDEEEYEGIHNKHDRLLLEKGGNSVYEAKIKCEDGKYRDVLVSKSTLINENSEVEGLVCVMMDISERKRGEEKIKRLSRIKEDMLFISQSIIKIKDIEELFGLILEKAIDSIENAKYGNVMILENGEELKIKSHKGYELLSELKLPLKHSFLWLATEGNIENPIIIHDMNEIKEKTSAELRKEIDKLNLNSCISVPLVVDNKFYGILNIESSVRDAFTLEDLELMKYIKNQVEVSITNHKMYEKIIYLSRYDKLTNVYNRTYFENVFFSKIRNVNEFNIVIFDLNGLKMINDKYGHLAGDEYILEFTKKIKSELKDNEVLARYGGDEFIGIYFRNEKDLINIFYHIIKEFKKNPLKFEGNEVPCSFSFGIANCTRDSKNYEELIKIADDRMYKLKGNMKKEGE